MKKIALFCLQTLFLFGCTTQPCTPKKLQKIELYEYGHKRILYRAVEEKAVPNGKRFTITHTSAPQNGLPVLYRSNDGTNPFIATSQLVVKLSDTKEVQTLKARYGLRLIKPINKRLGLYLFEAPKDRDIIDLTNRLNEAGFKAKINYYSPYKLY